MVCSSVVSLRVIFWSCFAMMVMFLVRDFSFGVYCSLKIRSEFVVL